MYLMLFTHECIIFYFAGLFEKVFEGDLFGNQCILLLMD
ncbi:hypothetical protein ApDm4_0017 [Acetobacter pomorum]|nr:hypothetical protein ApDm4_0017 [Acetobacter pomorum]